MADALGSGPSESNLIGVQVPSRALFSATENFYKRSHSVVFFCTYDFSTEKCRRGIEGAAQSVPKRPQEAKE